MLSAQATIKVRNKNRIYLWAKDESMTLPACWCAAGRWKKRCCVLQEDAQSFFISETVVDALALNRKL